MRAGSIRLTVNALGDMQARQEHEILGSMGGDNTRRFAVNN